MGITEWITYEIGFSSTFNIYAEFEIEDDVDEEESVQGMARDCTYQQRWDLSLPTRVPIRIDF